MHEPMEAAIDQATEVVSSDGYLHADDKAVQLAAMGYLARQFRSMHEDTRHRIDEGFAKLHEDMQNTCAHKRSRKKQMTDGVKATGLFAAIVALLEAARAFFS